MIITRDIFIAATGYEPEDDDLERCNCPVAGTVGHFACGWDAECGQPRFMTGHFLQPDPHTKGIDNGE